ncbi:hypothetical protein GJ496_010569 [Pomphorhynchus laevis]|nr:hypothetical protein GJ496_010569 [Pomphorhynchus laevis]
MRPNDDGQKELPQSDEEAVAEARELNISESGPTEPSSASVFRISLNPTKGSDELIPKSVCSQINRDKKCEDFREFLRLKDYGLHMPTNMRGLAPSQLKDLNLTHEWARDYESSGGYNYNADPFLERNGEVDSTLVKLKNCQTSYINANFVGYKPANRSYILTQGPLSNTISHFWNMVWQENVRSIIMLNNILRSQHVFEHSPVIHCSAGIGRSGTFAFVDIVLTLLAASEGCNSHVQLMNILHHIRNQRPGLIQTPEQLRFCFLSIIRAFCDVNMKINPKWWSQFERLSA